ncbi:hypothetical protein [Cardinium endosymbiont of Tipula unca]|uniref:hypothetical protein n=1 Tax=Cardinium endosymbiont of Tipula unca TaxID=3066216 RepID=UPI0030CAAA5F
MALYAIDQIKSTIIVSKQCSVCFCNNNALSFELKDNTEKLICNDLAFNRSADYVASYDGFILASWHGKMVLSIKEIPSAWYVWYGPKLDVDDLLIAQSMLDDVDVLLKVCSLKRLIIYGNQPAQQLCFLQSKMSKLGISYIWLKLGEKKEFAWSIMGEKRAS